MSVYVQPYQTITYDGTNAADVLSYVQHCGGDIFTWSILSETAGTLTLGMAYDGGTPQPCMTVTAGQIVARIRQADAWYVYGPWDVGLFDEAFAELVPRAAFDALAARVAALEASHG